VGRGGLVKTPFGIIGQTADGAYDPAAEFDRGAEQNGPIDGFVHAAQSVRPRRARLRSGVEQPCVVFPFRDRTLVAVSAKAQFICLTPRVSAARTIALRSTPRRWSNDAMAFGFNGMWSVMST
jgi:hypothetical protein